MANNQTSSDDFDKLLDEFIASQLQETESAFDDTAVEKKTEESLMRTWTFHWKHYKKGSRALKKTTL